MALTDTREGKLLARWIEQRGLASRMPPVVLRLLGLAAQLNRYAIVSALALGLDIAVYLALAQSGYRATFAGMIGYAIGMALHFSLSTRFVFKRGASGKSEARLFTEFALSGLVGLAITAVVIEMVTGMLGLSAMLAKVLAVIMSFMAVFVLRKSVVFASIERRRRPRD
jgi:putative flippase GtrA